MQEWEASPEEKASQEVAVSCSLEGEEREVSGANGKDKAFNYQSDYLVKHINGTLFEIPPQKT